MLNCEKFDVLQGLQRMTKDNFLNYDGKDLMDIMVVAWNLHCIDIDMEGCMIINLQDNETFTKSLCHYAKKNIDELCRLRIEGVEYAWIIDGDAESVDKKALKSCIRADFNNLFYYMLSYPKEWANTEFWSICFDEKTLELMER